MFNAIAELIVIEMTIPIGIPTKKAKEDMEAHSVIVEPKIRKCSIQFRVVQTLFCF